MIKNNTSRAPLCVAALLLCAIASAQWSQRWDTDSTYPDEAQCVAVDHFGDVYVAGKSKEFRSGSYYDLTVLKYSPTGTLLWKRGYNSKDSLGADINADTIATGIAVDWQGDVYASGLASNGSENKFVVIKYLSDGSTAWPSSGSAGTGAVFNNKAVMLSDSDAEGVGPLVDGNPPICAISMENVSGYQPTFAITGPCVRTDISGTHKGVWKTVVFQDDGVGAVQIKSGWPVSQYGYSDEDAPYAVAINSSDGTVAVTGGAHVGGGANEYFTVQKYTSGGGAITNWPVTKEGTEFKCNYGKAITLDASGNVYATGYLSTGEDETDSEYETIRINGSDATDNHDIQYANTYLTNEATSIGLSTELVGGTPTTFIYVTGLSDHDNGTGAPGPLEMATLRYSYSGSALVKEWSGDGAKREGAAGDTQGLSLAVGGNGNCYVVGSANNGTDDDYILAAYKKDGSKRYANVIYDGGGADDAFSVAILGAGQPCYTGASYGGSTYLDDFYTVVGSGDTVTSTYPYTESNNGNTYSGTLSNVDSLDGVYWSLYGGPSLSSSHAETNVTYMIPASGTPSELSFTVVGHVNTTHIWQKIQVYDFATSSTITLSNRPAPNGTDDTTTVVLPGDPSQYISSGYVVVTVSYYGDTTVTGWVSGVDGLWRSYFDLTQLNSIGA